MVDALANLLHVVRGALRLRPRAAMVGQPLSVRAPRVNTVVSLALPPGRGNALRLLLNFVGFQCGWFGCVLGAARGWPGAGAAMAAAIVATHVVRAARPGMELKLVSCAV